MALMTYCSRENLQDLEETLEAIRTLPGVQEVKPGVFHLKSRPFLHFLQNSGGRWANVRRGNTWGLPLALPSDMDALEQRRVLREIKDRYLRTAFTHSRQVVA